MQRKRAMFENVHIDWRITSHDDGSTDFSDDDGLDDDRINGYNNNNNNVTRTPDRFTRKIHDPCLINSS